MLSSDVPFEVLQTPSSFLRFVNRPSGGGGGWCTCVFECYLDLVGNLVRDLVEIGPFEPEPEGQFYT